MLDSLHHLVYGWEKIPGQLSSFEILSSMFLVSRERPIRLNDIPLTRVMLLDMLLQRLTLAKCSQALCEIAKMVIELLTKRDEMLSYFVLVATHRLDDQTLLSTLRLRSVSLNLAMEDWFSENTHTDNLQRCLYSSPIIKSNNVTQLPWDISSVLGEDITRIIELNQVNNNVSKVMVDEFSQPTSHFWSLLRDKSLNVYCKYNEDYMKYLNNGCDAEELKFDYHYFDQATAKKCVVLLHKHLGSYIFQPNKKNEAISFDISLFCEVDGLGGNTGTIHVMKQHLSLYHRLTQLIRRIQFFDPKSNRSYNLVKECCLEQYHYSREEMFSQLDSPKHIQYVLRLLARYVDDLIVFFTHICHLLESDLVATEISCELKKIYYSSSSSISELTISVLKPLNEHIASKIESYLVNGCWSENDAVFTNAAPTETKDRSISLPIHLQPNEDISLSLSVLIVQHGCVMNIVKNTEYEKYLNVLAQGYHDISMSVFEVLHLGDVISSIYRKVQNPDLIRDLLTDLTYSVKVLATVYLHDSRYCITQNQPSSASKILKEKGVPLRHIYTVEVNVGDFSSTTQYKPPAPLSFFIPDMQLNYYKEIQSLLNSLIGAEMALQEMNVSDDLPFVLGEDRRALIRRQHVLRFINGLKDFILCEIREAWNVLQKQLLAANSIAKLITAFRIVMKSLRQATFLHKNSRSYRQLIYAICSSCLDFCNAFVAGNDRNVEVYHKKFADNAQILCQNLAIDKTEQSQNILWRVDYFSEIIETNTVDQSTMNISALSKER